MRILVIFLAVISLLVIPISAMEYTAPELSGEAQDLLPNSTTTFGADLWTIISKAIGKLQPSLAEAIRICGRALAIMILIAICACMSKDHYKVTELAGVLAIGTLLLSCTRSMVTLAADTVSRLGEYGKLLLPVLSAAVASQGGVTTGAALYTGTIIFDTVLSAMVSKFLVPMVYAYLVLVLGAAATGEAMLSQLSSFVKWLSAWLLKAVLYVFTGYMAITGVVSGSTDAMTLKAAKITMSGMVPVVGSILSDASEAVLVGAGVVKNAVGIYGALALVAIWIAPFLQIGIQYILLKVTTGIGQIFGLKSAGSVLSGFCTAMGLLLAMTGSVCIMLLISVVCFMKGMM